jgi:Xaa-Pro dipeptidase
MRSVKDRIGKVFDNTDADAIVLLNTRTEDSNFLYLTDFTSGVFEGTLMIASRRRLILFASPLEYEIAKEQRPKEMLVVRIESADDIKRGMRAHLSNKVVGVNESFIPYSSHKRIREYSGARKLVDVSKAFDAARMIKSEDEIGNIRIANRITKGAFAEVRRYIKLGMTEKELAARLDYLMMERGADGLAFGTIVSFGKNAALPHHMPDSTRLKPNSFVLMDFGAKYRNYCADVTRTLIFKPDRKSKDYKRMAEMYGVVKKAQNIALKTIKPGVDASIPHIEAEKHIDEAAHGRYKGKFIHSLGHSIGIDVHDGRIGLSPNLHFKLKAGMVFSDEPGIYIVGFGGVRIEDDVLVTEKGGRII